MKKLICIVMFFCTNFTYAGTGAAKDEYYITGLIILVLAAILGILYLTGYIIKKIRKRKTMEPEMVPGNEAAESES